MQTIEQQLQDLEEKIHLIEVLPDELAYWRDNKVTKKFLMQAQYAMMLVLDIEEDDDYGESVDRVALVATKRRAMKSVYEDILTWNPANFLDEEQETINDV